MVAWNVEKANVADAAQLSGLYSEVWSGFLADFPAELMGDRMPSPEAVADSMKGKAYFVVRDHGKIIGVARAAIAHGACLLDRMVVHPQYRRKGVGRALTASVIEYARENGAAKVWLDTSPKLGEAVALYESMGFKECGRFNRHYWGTDIDFYELLL